MVQSLAIQLSTVKGDENQVDGCSTEDKMIEIIDNNGAEDEVSEVQGWFSVPNNDT